MEVGNLRAEDVPGGAHAAVVDGNRCRTAPELFSEFSTALAFPRYFGHNWDAFNECLSDLLVLDDGGLGAEFGDRHGIPVRRLLVVVSHAERLLAGERERESQRSKCVSAFRWAASGSAWHGAPRVPVVANLIVLFHSTPESFDGLVDWLDKAGLRLA